MLPNLRLTTREIIVLCRRLEAPNGGGIDAAAALRFFGCPTHCTLTGSHIPLHGEGADLDEAQVDAAEGAAEDPTAGAEVGYCVGTNQLIVGLRIPSAYILCQEMGLGTTRGSYRTA